MDQTTDLNIDTWEIINDYFKTNPNWLAKHQIDSYNDFVEHKIPLVIKSVNHTNAFMFDKLDKDVTYQVDIYLGGKNANKFKIAPPSIYEHKTGEMRPLYPNEARLKNLTYGFDIFIDMEVEYTSKRGTDILFEKRTLEDTNFLKNIYLGKIPIMLHSNMCSLNKIPRDALPEFGESKYEPGGYFIIDGREKMIISQERKVENAIIISSINKTNTNRYVYSVEIKSMNDEAFENPRNNKILLENDGTMTFLAGMAEAPFIQPFEGRYVPLFILFRMFGIESDTDIMKMIVGDMTTELGIKMIELLRPCAHDPLIIKYHVYDRQNAEKYLEPLTSRSKTNITTTGNDLMDMHKNKVNKLSFLYDTILENVLPHSGVDFLNKAYYLAYMTRKMLLRMLDIEKDTDRDSFLYKRLDTSGNLLATLFKECLKQGFMYNARREIESRFELSGNTFLGKNVINIVHQDNYFKVFDKEYFMNGIPKKSPGFMSSLKKGAIGLKAGVVQAIDRINAFSVISHVRRLNDPVLGGRVQDGQRHLHNTHYGYLCPAETPEGQTVGLRKALSMLTTITIGYPTNQLRELCYNLGCKELKYLKVTDTHIMTKLFINGNWIGCVISPKSMVDRFRLMRRNGLINHTTSIAWYVELNEIHIFCDNGRLVRPLLIIGNGNELLLQPSDLKAIRTGKQSFSDLCTSKIKRQDGNKRKFTDYSILKLDMLGLNPRDPELDTKLKVNQAVMEYIDLHEMNTLLLAKDINYEPTNIYKYTHVDLHPAVILGVMALTSPSIHHGQGGKYFGHTKHIKQAVSAYTDNFMHRIDTSAHLLHNPEKPLIQTKMTSIMNHDKLGTGNNIIVAIAYYNGFNQDDSIIGNRTSIDLGLFNSSYYKVYEEAEKKDEKAGMEEYFFNPKYPEFDEVPESLRPKQGTTAFDSLDKYGFIKEGTYLTEKDTVMIGKYLKMKNQSNDIEYVGMNKTIKEDNLDCYVDKVFTCTTNSEGNRLCKIRTCQYRRPLLGDKFASRNGQKGTFGLLLPKEDMPFTNTGLVPDIILHPSAYPKRMTLNQLAEILYGTLSAECGFYGIANGLDSFDIDIINEIICDKLGFSYYGDEVLYNGVYGEQMNVAIFMGPMFYQRLKLQVQDKINSRTSGYRVDGIPVPGGSYTVRERAVVSGRSNGGGIKIGEMERDALLAHGVSGFINELSTVRGDKFYIYVSTVNGEIAIANQDANIYFDPMEDGPLSYHLTEGTGLGRRDIIGLNTLHKKQTAFVKLAIPYSMKLVVQELNGLGMRLRLQPGILKMLIDYNETGKSTDDIILEMEDIIQDDEAEIMDMLETSLSEQTGDAEDKIVESYQNAGIQELNTDGSTPLSPNPATNMSPNPATEFNFVNPMKPIFKHADEFPAVSPPNQSLNRLPLINVSAKPLISSGDINNQVGGELNIQAPAILSLPPPPPPLQPMPSVPPAPQAVSAPQAPPGPALLQPLPISHPPTNPYPSSNMSNQFAEPFADLTMFDTARKPDGNKTTKTITLTSARPNELMEMGIVPPAENY